MRWYREDDYVAGTLELTEGKGVHFAIDGIGGDTLPRTLAAVRPYGMAASIGQVAGDISSIDPGLLGPARSIALSRPSVFRFMGDLAHYREGATATLGQLQAGLCIHICSSSRLKTTRLAFMQVSGSN